MIVDRHVHLNGYHEQVAISLDESLHKHWHSIELSEDLLEAPMRTRDAPGTLTTRGCITPHRRLNVSKAHLT